MLAAVSVASADVLPWPYLADFEVSEGYPLGPITSDPTWSFPDLVAAITGDAFAGDQAFSFTGAGALTLHAPVGTAVGASVTWIDFHSRPIFSPLADLPDPASGDDSTATGFVKIDEQGEIYAVDGNGSGGGAWVASGHRAALAGDQSADWMRISYRLDYTRKTWDLFLDGRLVLPDLGFLDASVTGFTKFSIRGDEAGATALDHFYAGFENPLFADTSGDGLPDAWLSAYGLNPAISQRYADPDRDGVTHLVEFQHGLNPVQADTDGDGVWDRRELLFGTNPALAEAYSLGLVPFSETFETDMPGPFVDGTRLWRVDADSAVSAVIERPSSAPEGAQHLVLRGAPVLLERHFNDAGQSSVWLDFRLRAQPRSSAPDIAVDTAAAFYFTTDGSLMALDGNGQSGGTWRALAIAPSNLSLYHRITLHLDYANQTWSLWHDGVRGARDFGFAHPVPYFSGFALAHNDRVTHPAGLDGLVVSHSELADFDNDFDGLTNNEELALGTNPDHPDSDDDGIWDGAEVANGLDPLVADALVARLGTQPDGSRAWLTSFAAAEGYTLGANLDQQLGWRSQSVTVAPTEEASLHAPDAATPASLDRLIGANGLKDLWLTFRARLEVGQLPSPGTLTGPLGALFGYSSEGTISTYDPALSAWRNHDVAATAGEWNTYTLHLDYGTRRWLLAVNGRLVARELPFRDAGLTTLTRLRLLQEGSDREAPHGARLDDLAITNVEPAGLDFDGDDLLNSEELALGTDRLKSDTDGDGLPDGWEIAHGLNPLAGTAADAAQDGDGDSLTTLVEYRLGTDPHVAEDKVPGVLIAQVWKDLPGNQLPDLIDSPRFPLQPTEHLRLDWMTLPFNYARDYGTRVRGYLVPPTDGEYVFWLAADNQASFWLSPTDSPFDRQRVARVDSATWGGSYNILPTQRSALIKLEAGKAYYFEILHKGGLGYDQLNLAWRGPDGLRQIVTAKHVASFARRADDLDGDGLPDAWEITHGLDSTQGHGQHGAHGDFDGDEFTNLDEYQLGSDPAQPDAVTGMPNNPGLRHFDSIKWMGEWDGLSDPALMEQGFSHEPNMGELIASGVAMETTHSLLGLQAQARKGSWITEGTSLVAKDRRGEFGWSVAVAEDSVYLLELVVAEGIAGKTSSSVFPLKLYVDGQYIDTRVATVTAGSSASILWFTPWLPAGTHDIHVVWDGAASGVLLKVQEMKLHLVAGKDKDLNAIPDWMDERLELYNSVEFSPRREMLDPDEKYAWGEGRKTRKNDRKLKNQIVKTSVSPLPLEGRARWPELSHLKVANQILPVEQGAGYRWFASVPLAQGQDSVIRYEGENGVVVREFTARWTPYNIFNGGELNIAAGSSLLVEVPLPGNSQNWSSEILLNGEAVALSAAGLAVLDFPQPGIYVVKGIRTKVRPNNNGQSVVGEVIVNVHGASSETGPWPGLVLCEHTQNRLLPEAPLRLEADSRLGLAKLPDSYAWQPEDNTEHRFVMRVGQDGPIIQAIDAPASQIFMAQDTYMTILETLPDGTRVVESMIILSPKRPGHSVKLEIIVGGVLFDDGTRLKTLAFEDFDELGQARILFLWPPDAKSATCHKVSLWYLDNKVSGK